MTASSTDYNLLEMQVSALLTGERNFIANAANLAAFLYQELPEINWAGFYFLEDAGLVLGPFCGKPASARLAPGRGVCGAAVREQKTITVDDVQAFEDHIVCDSASRSEIVVPLFKADMLFGVLDLDSPAHGRFSPQDKDGLERIVQSFLELTDVPAGMLTHAGKVHE
ncbi:MAG: GAF domain-containing protein [Vulcanimicrobiaceae bacterium]